MRTSTTLSPLAVTLAASALLAGCGGSGNSPKAATTPTTAATATTSSTASSAPAKAPPSTNPCTLLTDAEVAKLAPGVGHGKLDTVAGGAKICDWPDTHGIPAVQLQLYPAPSSSLRAELKNGIDAFGGYTIVDVTGIGDEAAAAFQKPDASKGLTAGLATLTARSGDRVIQLSTPRIQVLQDSQGLALVKQLAATALSRAGR